MSRLNGETLLQTNYGVVVSVVTITPPKLRAGLWKTGMSAGVARLAMLSPSSNDGADGGYQPAESCTTMLSAEQAKDIVAALLHAIETNEPEGAAKS